MPYHLHLEFLSDDHRLRGSVEREIPDAELWRSTTRQLLDGTKPTILARYPHIEDAIDFIELLQLRIEKR